MSRRHEPETQTREGPLYLQIADRLREEIGALNRGERISKRAATREGFEVSRFTVAKAVEQLVEDGLIMRKQGSGTFVAEAPLQARSRATCSPSRRPCEAAGHAATHKVLAFRPVEWSPRPPLFSRRRR